MYRYIYNYIHKCEFAHCCCFKPVFQMPRFLPPPVNSMNVQVLVGGALRRVSRPIGCSEQNLGVAAAALGQIPWHRVFHSWDLCIHPAKPCGIPNDLTPPIQAC